MSGKAKAAANNFSFGAGGFTKVTIMRNSQSENG